MLFVGDDWAEAHHDVELVDETGRVLVKRRLPEGIGGLSALHSLIGDHLGEEQESDSVIIGIETDRGPWVAALAAAGYTVFAVNPLQVARYRERHGVSGAKSDPGDAHTLAELVRLDRAHHTPLAPDSTLAEQVKVLARSHQTMIWARQRQGNLLRSTLREFYPAALLAFGEELTGRDSLAVLAAAPSPAKGAALSASRIQGLLRRAGRQRYLEPTAARIQAALRTPQLGLAPALADTYAVTVTAVVAVIAELNRQIDVLAEAVGSHIGQHPDAEIYRSQPGLGTILGARVLAEFGDAPERYADAKARKNYSGMSPITRASGTKRVVLARYARNRRLADALYQQAFASLTASPGARAYYDRHRAAGATHHQALRTLANRLVGILHGCLAHGTTYDETTAWHGQQDAGTQAA
ncbi:MAG: IS110 family transposase [Candidatus Nanopelagicales bacterium]|nr:IS110 family transposase [Candidatus Nanopelagicales bacterium]